MKKKLKILMVEDSKDDATLIMRNISQDDFKPVYERVETPETMETALNSKDWDIILSDYNMPNFSGLDALKIFKKMNLKIPFIIISGTIGEDLAIETIRKGASDYLMKDNLARLVPSIKRGLQETKIKEERENALKELIQSEERLKSFMNSATELFSIWDSEINLIELNKAAIGIFSPGAKKKDLIGKNISDLIPGIKETGNYNKYLEIIKTGKTYYHEQSTPPQFGNRNLAVKAFKVGNGLGMLTTDITERKKAENAIKNLAKFPSENPNPVIRVDFEGKIIFTNEACKNKLKDWKCKKGSSIPDPIYDLVKNKLKNKPLTIDIISGKSIYEFFITPVKEEGYINLYGRDITARKLAEDKLRKSYSKLQKTLNGTINALAFIIETNDPYTSGHQKRVAFLAIAISEELGLDENQIEAVGTAALIHDIGKINIPASILSKPGKLSDIEFEMIKAHPRIGYDIIKKIKFPYSIEKIILQHHERLNGSGYPNGLKNNDIIPEAKILGVADVVEAMSSHRPYRPSLGIKNALKEIGKGKRKFYDSKVVDACIKIIVEKKYEFY